MTDSANFTVRLIDKVTGGARSAARGLSGLERGLGRTARGTGRLAGGLDRATVAGGRFASGMGSAERSTRGFGGALDVFKGGLLTLAVAKLAQVGAEAVRAGRDLIFFGQNSRLALANLDHFGVGGAKLFEHSSALARRFGLDLFDTTKQYQKLLALQFNPKEIDKLVKMTADLRAATGATKEETSGLLIALGQIKAKGRVQAEEMLQLAERGVSQQLVWEEAGKLLGGKSLDQVRQLQEQGKLSADVGLVAIERAINRKLNQSELGQAGAKFADQTLEGISGRFTAWSQDAGVKLFERVTTPLTKLAGEGLTRFTTFLSSPEGAALIERMAVGLEKALDVGIKLSQAFGSGFGRAWDQMVTGADALFGSLSGGNGLELAMQLATTLGEASALAVGFGIALAGLGATVVLAGGKLWEFGKALAMGIFEPLMRRAAAIVDWWDTLTATWNDKGLGLVSKSFEIGKQLLAGLAKGIWSAAHLPLDAAIGALVGVVKGVQAALGIHSPSRVFERLGLQTSAGFAVGMEAGGSRIEASTRAMLASSSRAVSSWTVPEVAEPAASSSSYYGPEASSFRAPPPSFDSAAVGGRYGDVSIRQEIYINGSQDPESVADEVMRSTRRELDAYFRELGEV